MIQIVEIQMTTTDSTKQKLWATLYDPLGIESNLEMCQAKWLSFTLPMLQQWLNRDVDRAKLLNVVPHNRATHSTRSSNAANNESPTLKIHCRHSLVFTWWICYGLLK
ncbi:hypothetical protein PC129_g8576 [Phytophthora cactorum]|uniref:Uncharacterized protein n=1 Tax=Phytophthora cactorum TaxID=29920 RepID=A0A329STD3_9STRA|nr:hypothetical protein Pcac1_g24661 [Phytophthora cactorum]KAG2836119.1 hypothetical protein PC112_g5401 [Phytophthora cactorum]KAG2847604.1 hypothetical protein PC111_g720 [Phytophthora cactorum]KAG2932611.1 hypothetical protein PC114_g1793 [Phytophthora cactorum]KAG2936990.1 hypothetical protein PC115_g4466 [Phytophthora cactorum]